MCYPVNPKIEDLRKKAYVLYDGPTGPELVNKTFKTFDLKEDGLTAEDEKRVLNGIIKAVFVDHVGLEKAKEMLSKEVTHVSGYHTPVQADEERVTVIERIRFLPWLFAIIAIFMALILAATVYYGLSFSVPEKCESAEPGPNRDACFMSLAVSEKSVSMCDEISTLPRTYACYGTLGNLLENASLCRMIPDNEIELAGIRDKCIMCVAYKTRDAKVCQVFTNPIRVSECEAQTTRSFTLAC